MKLQQKLRNSQNNKQSFFVKDRKRNVNEITEGPGFSYGDHKMIKKLKTGPQNLDNSTQMNSSTKHTNVVHS